MQHQNNLYHQRYKQLNLLGKGNYGQAYRAKSNIDGKFYVAKKMMLEGMSEQEIQAAWGEIDILKKFSDVKIPFIVEYKECFQFENELIIIMEYCECGDLSTYLKNCKKNKQILSEKIIAYWFIQLLFGIKALHSKNVLHRDLKSANVFVTSNYCLKIGDFGISKILDATSAKTCIGTPLYLSPEVCNSQPYGLSSDLWALGCIMYELCALKYPFQASNMIVLAKKIVCDDVKPIPSHYSKDLNDIIMKLFIKDNKKRITVDQIFQTNYVKKTLFTFKQDQGRLKQIATPIDSAQPQETNAQKTGNQSNLVETKRQEQDTMKTINSVMEKSGPASQTLQFSKSLTASERMKLKKEQEVERRIQQLNKAALESGKMKQFAVESKQKNLGHTMGSKGITNQAETQKKALEQQFYTDNKAKYQTKFKAKEMEKMQNIDLDMIQNTIKNLKTNNFEQGLEFQDVPLPSHSQYVSFGNQQTLKKNQLKNTSQIQQQINDDDELQEYYDEQFEDYEQDPTEIKTQKQAQKKEEYESVKAFYQNQIDSANISPVKRQKIQNIFKNQVIKPSTENEKIQKKRQESIKLVGQAKYNQLYAKVVGNKINNKTIKEMYKPNEVTVIRNIEEIEYFQQQKK